MTNLEKVVRRPTKGPAEKIRRPGVGSVLELGIHLAFVPLSQPGILSIPLIMKIRAWGG